jgi:uncharacterized coiled-coil DUF342 family protein
MALAKEDIEEIQNLIARAFSERPEINQVNVRYELEIRERIVRVEEELKHQRESMIEGFNRVDKRFEQMILEMNARFVQVDKRFEQVDKRFEQVDKRFEVLTSRIDRFMIWSFATTLTVGGMIIAAIKFLP